jgi:hypothetical protein
MLASFLMLSGAVFTGNLLSDVARALPSAVAKVQADRASKPAAAPAA